MRGPVPAAGRRSLSTGPAARLAVRLTPKARADAVEGWDVDPEGRDLLKVRVRAAPVEGAANAALTRLIAQALGVAPSSVRLTHGGQSRLKRVGIDGLDEAEVRARLSPRPA